MEEGQNNQFLSNGSMDSAAPTSATPPMPSPTVASKSSIENAQYMTNVIEKKPNIFKRFGKKAAEVFKKLNQPIDKKPKIVEMPAATPAAAPAATPVVAPTKPEQSATSAEPKPADPKPATPKKAIKLPKFNFKKPDFSDPKTKKTAIIIGVITAAALVITLIVLAIIKAQSLAGGSLASDGSNLSELYLPQPPRKTEQLTQEEMEMLEADYSEVNNNISRMKTEGKSLEEILEYLDKIINNSVNDKNQSLWFSLWMKRCSMARIEEGNPQKALKYLEYLDINKLSIEQLHSVYSIYSSIYRDLGDEDMTKKYEELRVKTESTGKILGNMKENSRNA